MSQSPFFSSSASPATCYSFPSSIASLVRRPDIDPSQYKLCYCQVTESQPSRNQNYTSETKNRVSSWLDEE